jgi:hypothetical protein
MIACALAAQQSLGGERGGWCSLTPRQISYILFQAHFINSVDYCEGNRTKVTQVISLRAELHRDVIEHLTVVNERVGIFVGYLLNFCENSVGIGWIIRVGLCSSAMQVRLEHSPCLRTRPERYLISLCATWFSVLVGPPFQPDGTTVMRSCRIAVRAQR